MESLTFLSINGVRLLHFKVLSCLSSFWFVEVQKCRTVTKLFRKPLVTHTVFLARFISLGFIVCYHYQVLVQRSVLLRQTNINKILSSSNHRFKISLHQKMPVYFIRKQLCNPRMLRMCVRQNKGLYDYNRHYLHNQRYVCIVVSRKKMLSRTDVLRYLVVR